MVDTVSMSASQNTQVTAYWQVQGMLGKSEARHSHLDALEERLGDDWVAILEAFLDAIECGDCE